MPAARPATSTTIAQSHAAGVKPSVVTRASLGIRQIYFDAGTLQDKGGLYRVIEAIQSNFFLALRALGANPVFQGNLLTGLAFTAATVSTYPHGLGRPWRGYIVTQAVGGYPSFQTAALPTGTNAAQLISLLSANTGTFDLLVY